MWVSEKEQMKGTSSKYENKFNFVKTENFLSSTVIKKMKYKATDWENGGNICKLYLW